MQHDREEPATWRGRVSGEVHINGRKTQCSGTQLYGLGQQVTQVICADNATGEMLDDAERNYNSTWVDEVLSTLWQQNEDIDTRGICLQVCSPHAELLGCGKTITIK